MKINESLIFKFIYTSSKKLLLFLNKTSFEVNNVLNFKCKIHKIISGKIIEIINKNNKYLINLDIGKKNITIIQNVNNINFIKNLIVAVVFLKKKINNNIFIYSLKELNINNDNNIFILPKNTKLGIKLSNLLLNSNIFDLKIPNNRLDCFNAYGISKELSLINNIKINLPFKNIEIFSSIKNEFNVYIKNRNICSKYSYFIINNIKNFNIPIEIKEKLIHSEFKINNNIYDLINYIFLETGYKINIFNINNIKNKKILIKLTNKNSNFIINNNNIYIYEKTLLICNTNNEILNIPGIDNNYELNNKFNNLFIGCGSFNFELINSNKYRYDKINNYLIKNNEIEVEKLFISDILKYFIKIISNFYSIEYSNICNIYSNISKKVIHLNINKLYKFLGFKINFNKILNILLKLRFKYYINKNNKNIINVLIPNIRSDINTKEDLFEEIIKIYGYNKIPKIKKINNENLCINNLYKYNVKNNLINKIKKFLVFNGYNEVISYSLINKNKQNLIFNNNLNNINILNPMSINMSSIRKTLLIGLLDIIKFNENNQENNIKIFEYGYCFNKIEEKIISENILSGVNYGYKKDDFLKIKSNKIFDFYDIKGNVEDILLFFYNKDNFIFIENKDNYIFDLNKSLKILDIRNNINVGIFGYLNKNIIEIFKLKNNITYFEIYIDNIISLKNVFINKICNYPINKRDISITIDNSNNINEIMNYLNNINNNQIIKLNLIDFYKEDIINNIFNNFTIRFYIQNKYKILKDSEINQIINNYIISLKNKFNIKIKF